MINDLAHYLLPIVLLATIVLHIVRKNSGTVVAYGIQSLAVTLIILGGAIAANSLSLMIVALCTLAIKVIAAPKYFSRLIKKHEAIYSVSTYLNIPLSLVVIATLAAVAFSDKFAPLTAIVPANQMLLQLALASIFMSLFLVVNRRGALSQIVGVLSLENSIVCFAVLASLEQSALLQIGILFDIAIWIIIAIVFVSMIYAHFGSPDITSIKHLKD